MSPRRRHSLPEILDLKHHGAAHVTARQLAAYWAVHVVTVQRWVREGDLPGVRFRGVWRIKTDDARLFELRLFSVRRAS